MKQIVKLNESQFNNLVTKIVKKSVKKVLKEVDYSKVERPRDFTHDEILKLVSILKENPIDEMWKPYDLGWCKVQRVEANQAGSRVSLLSKPHNISSPEDCYSKGVNGELFLQIGRMPNTHWREESGYTYMCWK